jgi:hypothetical protein
MPLPTVTAYPTKTITLPLCKAKVKFRPFIVKEEKNMILLRESKDKTAQDVLNCIVDVASGCISNKLDVKKIPLADLEYLFLNIRSLSKGKTSRLIYRCENVPDKIDGEENTAGAECGAVIPIDVNLEKVELTNDPEHKKEFAIPNSKMVIHMKYPTIKVDEDIAAAADAALASGKQLESSKIDELMLQNCVDMITVGEEVYKDFTPEEFMTFYDQIVGSVSDEIKHFFFDKFPVLAQDVPYKCDKCGYKQTIHLEGFQDFF